jgi:hypothetical protein
MCDLLKLVKKEHANQLFQSPFVKLGTFTLLGMPKIEIAAVPRNRRFLNVMNLPVISDFIYSSIRAATRQFVAPFNYTLDIGKILRGDDTTSHFWFQKLVWTTTRPISDNRRGRGRPKPTVRVLLHHPGLSEDLQDAGQTHDIETVL